MSIDALMEALEDYAQAEEAAQFEEHGLLTIKGEADQRIRLCAIKKLTEGDIETQVLLSDEVQAQERLTRDARIRLIRAKNAVEVAREHVRLERLQMQREIATLGAKGE